MVDRDVQKNWFGLNRMVNEPRSNRFFFELVQEKMNELFYKTNSVNQIPNCFYKISSVNRTIFHLNISFYLKKIVRKSVWNWFNS